MEIIRRRIESKKCGGCNYRTGFFYGFKGDNLQRLGLCANCFLDLIVIEGNMEVGPPGYEELKKRLLAAAKRLMKRKQRKAREMGDEKMIGFYRQVLEIYKKEGL